MQKTLLLFAFLISFSFCQAQDQRTFYRDADNDGYGVETDTIHAVEAPDGYTGVDGFFDCNDNDDDVHAEACERNDGKDNDCDGLVDEDAVRIYRDGDYDGYGDLTDPGVIVDRCDGIEGGYSTNNLDFNDNDESANPGATERCDDVDNDGDGQVDEGLPLRTFFRDADGDGYVNLKDSVLGGCSVDSAPAGYRLRTFTNWIVNADCDDTNSLVHEGCTTGTLWYRDADGDEYGDPTVSVQAVEAPDGYTNTAGDCNDQDIDINPGACERNDGKDNNCNGLVDDGLVLYYPDRDRDGYGDPTAPGQLDGQCGFEERASNNDDLNDEDENTYPGAPEACDGRDNNGDGEIDEGLDRHAWYKDNDGDGYGNPMDSVLACFYPYGLPGNYQEQAGDCDDTNPDIHGDCATATIWYFDGDGDGYGNPLDSVQANNQPADYVANNKDCDDRDVAVNPEAVEVCDGKDNNCDGITDGACSGPTWYLDFDGDGYGDPREYIQSETQPDNYVDNNTDCNDGDGDTHPGMDEVPGDGVDNDCDGDTDEPCKLVITCPDNITVTAAPGQCTYTFGDDSPVHYPTTQCANTYYYVLSGATTGRSTGTITDMPLNIGVTKVTYVALPADGQGEEDSCTFTVTVLPNGTDCGTTTWYRDADGDEYGDPNNSIIAKTQPEGYVANNRDCDDTELNVHPGMDEIPGDGVDNDCDGDIDEECVPVMTCPADITVTAAPGTCTYKFDENAPPSEPNTSCVIDFGYELSGATTGGKTGGIGGLTFNTGVTKVTYTGGDGQGTLISCSFTVTVLGQQASKLTGVSATPSVLWPPNHKMVDVTVNYSITGTACSSGGTAVLSVTGNDGATSSDWQILDAHHVRLRAERSGSGNGRTYTITITLTDAAGNKSTQTVNVVVPHDMSGKEKGKKDKGDLKVRVLPNPSQYDFTLQVQSSSDKKISVRVSNALGKIIEVKQNMGAKGTLRLGSSYAPGTYYAEVLQGSNRSVVKLVKLPR